MNKSLNLITDSAIPNFEGFEFLTESFDSDRPATYTLRGCYACAEKKNGNGRIYPYDLLKKEIDIYRTEMIETGRALGNLEHPDYPEVRPDEAAIRILSLVEDNKCWIGESVILASQPKFGIKGTPKADILLACVQYGTKMGFSTRCLGNVGENGVVSDLKMCAIDCVSNPSIGSFVTTDANRFVNGILESKKWICDIHGDFIEKKYDALESNIAKMPNTYIQTKKNEHIKNAINDFLNSIVQ